MHFALIAAVLAAITIAHVAPCEPAAHCAARMIASGAGMASVVLFAAVSSLAVARAVRTDWNRRGLYLRRFTQLKRIHAALWLGVAGAIFFPARWAQLVRFNWQLDGSFLLDDLLILAPVLLPLVASWAAFYEVDRAIWQAGHAEENKSAMTGRGRYLMLHVRHYLGLLLMPVVVMLAAGDLAALVAPAIVDSDHSYLVYAAPLALVIAMFPLLLKSVWQTARLPASPLRDRLDETARRAGVRIRDILIWRTDRLVVNAAVAGFVPRFRYVFLTDGMLEAFDDDEVEAVFAHEIGHLRHRHLPLRILAVLAPVLLYLACHAAAPGLFDAVSRRLAGVGISPAVQSGFIAPAILVAGVCLVLVWYSRWFEYQADFAAAGSLGDADSAEARIPEGTRRYVAALRKLAEHGPPPRRGGGWLHPTIDQRIRRLQCMAESPSKRAAFQRQMTWRRRVLVAAVVAAGTLLLLMA